jgi:hypothetical protein
LLGKLFCEGRKNACSGCKRLFSLQKRLPNKEFLSQDDEKSSASAQKQAKHTQENFRMLQLLWRMQL